MVTGYHICPYVVKGLIWGVVTTYSNKIGEIWLLRRHGGGDEFCLFVGDARKKCERCDVEDSCRTFVALQPQAFIC